MQILSTVIAFTKNPRYFTRKDVINYTGDMHKYALDIYMYIKIYKDIFDI